MRLRRPLRWLRQTAASLAAASTIGGAVRAAEPRWALMIGNDVGLAGDAPLRFAERDAERIDTTLRALGGFAPDQVVRILGADAAAVKATLATIEIAIAASGEKDALLFVYYSGHADALALHLAGTTLPLAELQQAIASSRAAMRVLVLDACRSGAATRVKGGVPGPSFAITLDDQMSARGTAILASTAAGEDALESDVLEASFFTHHFVSALHGAADADDDGRVTVNEAFHYASQHTLESTASTMSGPQHPTYRLELGGRHELVLTRPGLIGATLGAVTLPEPGTWIFRRGDRTSLVVGEVVADAPGARLALPPGTYRLTLRTAQQIRETVFVLAPGQRLAIDMDMLQRRSTRRDQVKGAAHTTTSPSLARRFLRREVAAVAEAPTESTEVAAVTSAEPAAPSDVRLVLAPSLLAGDTVSAGGELALTSTSDALGWRARFGGGLTIEDVDDDLLVSANVIVGGHDARGSGLGVDALAGLGPLGGRLAARVEAALRWDFPLSSGLDLGASAGIGVVLPFDVERAARGFGRFAVGLVWRL